MAEYITADIAVIGAGSGGLSVAAGASQMGAEVVLFERDRMGGDCLNTGCVPSKALIAAGEVAQSARDAARFGIHFGVDGAVPGVDFSATHRHVHDVIAAIEPNDSVERFESLGVRVIRAHARFISPTEVEADGVRVKARKFVIATGSRAALPPIPGLDEVGALTNENVFELTECPQHLIVIGGGPIGLELAQAHRRLGAEVTVLEAFSILPKDDPEAVALVRDRVRCEGVAIHEQAKVLRVRERTTAGGGAPGGVEPGGVEIDVELSDGTSRTLAGSHLLVAAGRRANVDDLGLEEAGIGFTARGIEVDARLRTENKRVFAIGDVAGGYQFTHVAGYHAGIVIRNALFKLPAKAKTAHVPWVTYTDPELAHVGVATELERDDLDRRRWRVLRWTYEENDRAQAERVTEGFIKVVVGRRGRIEGVTICGADAGELLLPWVLAIENGLKIGAMASVIAPYPTLSEVSKRVAGSYFTPSLFSERTRRIVGFLQRLPF